MTADEWAEVAYAIHDVYGKEARTGYITLGAALVASHSKAVIYQALVAHQRGERAQFVPTPGELCQLADRITGAAPPDFDEVWQEVTETIRRAGRRTDLSPPARRLVDFIGWYEVRMSDEPDVIRGQARRAYEDQIRRRPVEAARLTLTGSAARPRVIGGGS